MEAEAAAAAVVVAVVAAAAVAEVVLEAVVAAEAEGVEHAVTPDLDLQGQMESVTDSSSELAAAAVVEPGCSEERSGAKPETRHAALPCVEPLTVAASEVSREPEGLEDAVSAAAVVARVAVPGQLVQLGSAASVEAA